MYFLEKVSACLFHRFNFIFFVWKSFVYCVEGSQTLTLGQVVSPHLVNRTRINRAFDYYTLPFSSSVPDLETFYLILI